jgi:protein-L-isoaspartate O-methyltransferase
LDSGLRLPDAYFEQVYAASSDPWGFETSPYERRKQAILFASLPRERYVRAFEPGCSIGMVTAELATRANQVVAMEIVPAIAERAWRRVSGQPNVQVRRGAIPEAWPEGEFDLVLLSEVAYYLTEPGLAKVIDHAMASLTDGGDLVAVHYTGTTDYPMSGARVHEVLLAQPGLTRLVAHDEPEFSLLVMRK